MTQRSSAYFVRLNTVFAITLGVISALASLYLWARLHIHLPVHDVLGEMSIVQNVLEHGFFYESPGEWLARHSGAHRIAITRLLLVIDYLFFGGQNHVIFAASWAAILTTLLVLIRAFQRSYPSESTALIFCIGLALIFLTSHTQFLNIISPINGSWYVAMGASTLSIFLVTGRSAPPSGWSFVGAYLLSGVAALSTFGGVILWLLLPLLIACRSPRAGLLAALITAILLALYLPGIGADITNSRLQKLIVDFVQARDAALQDSSTLDKLIHNVTSKLTYGARILKKTCRYLGSPLSIHHPVLATLLVLFSFLILTAGWLKLLRRVLNGQHPHNTWFETNLALATLHLGIAISTQMGRVIFSTGTDSRYQTVVMLYWLCICGLLIYFSLRTEKAGKFWLPLGMTACLGIAATLIVTPVYSAARASTIANAASRTSALGVLGVSSYGIQRALIPISLNSRVLTSLRPFFERYEVAYRYKVEPQPVFVATADCENVKLEFKQSKWPGILIATGYINDFGSKWTRRILVSTLQGDIIGTLYPVFSPDATHRSFLLGDEINWEGYIRSAENNSEVLHLHYPSSLLSKKPCRLTM